MVADLSALCISVNSFIRDVIACIDRNAKGVALITDEKGQLVSTITDGDVRRALLAGKSLDAPVSELLITKSSRVQVQPLTAPVGAEPEKLLRLMREKGVRQIPLLDTQRRVVDLVTLEDLLPDQMPALQAVIMAGGLGTRLRPLTEDLPKPMLPVGGRPLMELIVAQLRQAGIRQVNVTTHYKPEKIVEHFGDGGEFGVEINYINEPRPLGTGGALGLMPKPDKPLLVINGDVLTQVDFRSMLAYHQEQLADMTVAVTQYEIGVPYGVVECEGPKIRRLLEKPQMTFLVNAGIYLLEPHVYQFIPKGQRFNMTDLIRWLMEAGRSVVSFPIREYWLDIGMHRDYVQAQKDVLEGKMTMDVDNSKDRHARRSGIKAAAKKISGSSSN